MTLFVLQFSLRPKWLGSWKVAMNGVLTICMAPTLMKYVKLAGLCSFVACWSNSNSIILSSRQIVRFKGITHHLLEIHHCYQSYDAHNSVSNTTNTTIPTITHIATHIKNTTCSMYSNARKHICHHDWFFLPLLIHPRIRGILQRSTTLWP